MELEKRSQNALVFMAKWPEPGRAKTRLSPPLTPAEAAEMARRFLLDTLQEAAAADADRFLAFAPCEAAPLFATLVGPDVGLIPAVGPHLGVGLCAGQAAALARGYVRVALVGSDLPHLPAHRYAEAFAALDQADAAIGPSGDGGYYLLAARVPTPALFEDIDWSTSAVLAQTLQRAHAAGLRIATLPACDDADTADDLLPLLTALRARPGAGHTLALLEQIVACGIGVVADNGSLCKGEGVASEHGRERNTRHLRISSRRRTVA